MLLDPFYIYSTCPIFRNLTDLASKGTRANA